MRNTAAVVSNETTSRLFLFLMPEKQTFFRLPHELTLFDSAKYVVVPVPYEGTVSFLKGTSRGPEAILAVSYQVEHFDEEMHFDMTKNGVATLAPIPAAKTPEEESRRIEEFVRNERLFKPGRIPIFLGGEHGITPPIVRVAAETYPQISVLQFDAHADLRHSYAGVSSEVSTFSHASAMRRVLETTERLVQVGIRSFSEEEYRECPKQIAKLITPAMIHQDLSACIDKILSGLSQQVYVTFDIDAFDSSIVPGTGTPEPGGLNWLQATQILRKVCTAKTIIGVDVVETLPLGNNNAITEFLAARLVAKIMAYTGRATTEPVA